MHFVRRYKERRQVDVQENPENAKQGVMPDDQTKAVKSAKDNQPKAKVDKANNANVGKKVEKKDVQQKK